MKKLLVGVLLISQVSYCDDIKNAVYLPQNKPAPFSGYLITPTVADDVRKQSIENDKLNNVNSLLTQDNQFYKDRLQNYKDQTENLSKQIAEQKDSDFLSKSAFFLLGAALTGLVSYGVYKSSK